MKTNIKIEIGLMLILGVLSLILQVYAKSHSTPMEEIITSGVLDVKEYEINGFDAFTSSLDYPIEYKIGEPKVIIKGDTTLLKSIRVEHVDKKLVIDLKNSNRYQGDYQAGSKITVFNNEKISYIDLRNNAKLKADSMEVSSRVQISLGGNTSFESTFSTDSIVAKIRANSSMKVVGNTQYLNAKGSENARFLLENLHINELELITQNNAGGSFSVSEIITAKANENSSVKIYGNPEKTRIESRQNARIKLIEE